MSEKETLTKKRSSNDEEDSASKKKLRRSSSQRFQKVLNELMLTAAGMIASNDCAEIIASYVDDFEAEVTGVFVCRPPLHMNSRHITGWDQANATVYMNDIKIDLKSNLVTDVLNSNSGDTSPLCRVGSHIWEVREESIGIFFRRFATEGGENLPRLNYDIGIKIPSSWFQVASTYHDETLKKQVVAVRLHNSNVCFLDAETGMNCLPDFEASNYELYFNKVFVLESKLAFVRLMGRVPQSPSRGPVTHKLVTYDFQTKILKESGEFLDFLANRVSRIHSIRNRIVVVSDKTVGPSDIMIFDEELRFIQKVYHGFQPWTTYYYPWSFVVEESLYLVDVYRKTQYKSMQNLVVKLT